MPTPVTTISLPPPTMIITTQVLYTKGVAESWNGSGIVAAVYGASETVLPAPFFGISLYAPMVQINWRTSDRQNESGSLKTVTKATIGVVFPVLVFAAAAFILAILFRRRRRRQRATGLLEYRGKPELDATNAPKDRLLEELRTTEGRFKIGEGALHELSVPLVVHEVSGDSGPFAVHELYGSEQSGAHTGEGRDSQKI
ncbi:MAG: hypothetical protein Q9157_003865 [Trypethelium eluteriae]